MSNTNFAPEMDALRQGMDWDYEDTKRRQILVETTSGDSHPGSVHLSRLAKMAGDGIRYSGAKPSDFTVTDICDGIAQGHDGMNYSLASRDMICAMAEIHQRANKFDGAVFISSCDKSVPAQLMAMARLDIPSIYVPGGVMSSGGDGYTLEQIGNSNVKFKQKTITEKEFARCSENACTGCGACQFMGTAATMQVMGEALGLALPHSALMPANLKWIDNMAKRAGKTSVMLSERNITSRDILTEGAFYNAVVVHGAIGGSTNALLHIPAIAHEAGVDFDMNLFDELHRKIPYLVNTRPVGTFSTELFWYAGGVPRIMLMLKDYLKLDVMTVTGKTLGENLEEVQDELDFYEKYLSNYRVSRDEIIKKMDDRGAIAILKGNIARDGAVVKYTGLPKSMRKFVGKARVFCDELSARNAIIEKKIHPGDCIVIKYAGPRGSGMPEMFYTTEAICADKELVSTTAIITDGRFSGASKGPCIGHISPEAAQGGEIGLIEDGDTIEIDIENRRLDAVGVDFNERRKKWTKPEITDTGILGIYKTLATSAMSGGYMKK